MVIFAGIFVDVISGIRPASVSLTGQCWPDYLVKIKSPCNYNKFTNVYILQILLQSWPSWYEIERTQLKSRRHFTDTCNFFPSTHPCSSNALHMRLVLHPHKRKRETSRVEFASLLLILSVVWNVPMLVDFMSWPSLQSDEAQHGSRLISSLRRGFPRAPRYLYGTEGLKRSPACSFSRLKNELLRRRDRADQQKSQNLAV